MPDFLTTSLKGRLTFIGVVKSRKADLKSEPLKQTQLSFDGIEGEDHGGRLRASCSRVSMMYPKGTNISNARQVSLMSDEELRLIAEEAEIDDNRPEWWGASLCFEGLPALSSIPPSSRLIFPSGAGIRIDAANGPCRYTADEVAQFTGGDPAKIKAAAKDRRGLVGSVEAEGTIQIGDEARLIVPKIRPYPYIEG